ncbi:hypothetical protein J113_24870 [Mycobacterium tuberculosis CAS/NITR204]|uniref:Uncharacterized protein n=1 Tax=Mycobacterium tuberculosis CAS/NITR204 TaxID=1310114 RepID=R4MM52_MYCTX|nr:hypothetical protein J113_24870 [Mycobacterium tuberculosis CAS/NITR204]
MRAVFRATVEVRNRLVRRQSIRVHDDARRRLSIGVHATASSAGFTHFAPSSAAAELPATTGGASRPQPPAWARWRAVSSTPAGA